MESKTQLYFLIINKKKVKFYVLWQDSKILYFQHPDLNAFLTDRPSYFLIMEINEIPFFFQLLIIPSLFGIFWMLHLSQTSEQSWSALIFGGATFFLFSVSTTFHTICYCGCHSRYIDFFSSCMIWHHNTCNKL